MNKKDKIIATVVFTIFAVVVSYIGINFYIAFRMFDEEMIWIWGFALFGITCITMMAVFFINIFDAIWKKKGK